jgi:hypothetical protein
MLAKRARSLVVLGALLFATPVAYAQDSDEGEEVVTRLKRHGGLSGGAANKLAKQVSKAMNRSADMTNAPNDPLRVRVSTALTGAPQPGDAMSTAKVRLRLYAGLTTWALDSLFRPAPGAIAACTRDFKLSTKECTALLAAGGQTSTAEVAGTASGVASAAPMAAAPPAAASAGAPPAGGSRFGRFSGTSKPVQPAPTTYAAAPPQSGRFGAQPSSAAPPASRAAPVAAAPVAAAGGSSTKDAYAARRAAYLEKQRARMNKPAPGAAAEPAAVAAAEAPEEAAEPVAAAPSSAKHSASAKAAAPAAAAAAAEEPAEAAPAKAPQLDGDFLDGLLEDPLGKK